MPENNLRQALVPVGATVIPQTRGTAPGLICPVGDAKVVYAVPGVPARDAARCSSGRCCPTCAARAGEPAVIASRVLQTWGESESGLNERLDDVIARLDDAGDPTLAFLARGWNGLEVRLTTPPARRRRGGGGARPVGGGDPRASSAPLVFGVDDESMESVVLDLLRDAGPDARARRVADRRAGRRPG